MNIVLIIATILVNLQASNMDGLKKPKLWPILDHTITYAKFERIFN